MHTVVPNTTDLNAQPPSDSCKVQLAALERLLEKGLLSCHYNQVSSIYPCEPVKQDSLSGQCSQIDQKHNGAINTIVPTKHPPYIVPLSLTHQTSVLQHNKQSKSTLRCLQPPSVFLFSNGMQSNLEGLWYKRFLGTTQAGYKGSIAQHIQLQYCYSTAAMLH